MQTPFDVAVVMPTILRPSIVRALHSIFAQHFPGRIQVLIGIDVADGPLDLIEQACAGRPANCVVQVLYPGYSTSVRHGGVSTSRFGGALRTLLSLFANSRLIAYLDDDNWYAPEHLAALRGAIGTLPWAWSLRWFVHPATGHPICIDTWESVGLGAGLFAEHFGGFVDTNCLMIDKTQCEPVLLAWGSRLPGDRRGGGEDRMVFDLLRRQFATAATGKATVFYTIDETDGLHALRLGRMAEGYARAGERAGVTA